MKTTPSPKPERPDPLDAAHSAQETPTESTAVPGRNSVRRCAVLLIEPREHPELDLASLFSGGHAVRYTMRWLAQAPHLGAPVDIDEDELAALGDIGETRWRERADLPERIAPATLDRLLAKGLLIGADQKHARHRERDERVRAGHWHGLAALHHARSRWSQAQHTDHTRAARERGAAELIREYGLPPPHAIERSDAGSRIALPPAKPSALDALFQRRVTCRNFDPDATLALPVFAGIMQRVFGAQAVVEIIPGAFGLKKAHPSGGGLHPLEAYALVRRVDTLAPGLYHYHPVAHALEPLQSLDAASAADLADVFLAGQRYFAQAPVHVVLTARFGRTFWKYRHHAKAYRAVTIEVGHVAQNFYLAATEAGLGAYITAAINEIDIERALDLDPMAEGALAVLGLGPRSAKQHTVEFDPLNAVWPPDRD